MTPQEFYEKRNAIKREARERDDELCKAYAYAHNPVKVGDVISDHLTTIRVERMGVYIGFGSVEMRYLGPELTKAGVPRKDGREACIYQSNIKRK